MKFRCGDGTKRKVRGTDLQTNISNLSLFHEMVTSKSI